MSNTWRIFFLAGLLVLGGLLSFSPLLFAQSAMQIVNLEEITKDLQLKNFKGKSLTRKIKVAILDNGFYGYEAELGKTLPKVVDYHKGDESEADKIDNRGLHGLFMAQIVHQVITSAEVTGDYEMHLFNAFGYTKFKSAVNKVIEQKFDIVLYAQVWEYGGNGDGKGFINALVNKAVDAGVLWINAAGNFGRLTRIAPVDGKVEGTEEWVQFKDEPKLKVNCAPKKGEQCSVRLVLAWNDFKEDSTVGTDKDLDLFLYDSKKRVVASGERRQKLEADNNDTQASKIPREVIEVKVPTGTYTIKVKVKSKNFSASQDVLRLTASGTGVDITSPSVGETLLPPADNPGAIVIGASDDFMTNRSLKNSKPDIWLKSLVRLKDGSNPYESSNAAAMATGLAVLHLGTGTESNRAALIEKLKTVSRKDQAADEKSLKKDLPLSAEKAAGKKESETAENKTLPDSDVPKRERRQQRQAAVRDSGDRLPHMYPAVQYLLRNGAGVTRVNGRLAIAINRGQVNLSRMDDDQVAVISPEGVRFYGPENGAWPSDYYQLVIVDK